MFEVLLNPDLYEATSFTPERELNHFNSAHVILLVEGTNSIVLVRKKDSNTFNLPGGKREGNEKPIDTLERELSEEIGLQPRVRYLGVLKSNSLNIILFTGKISQRGLIEMKPQAEIEEVKTVLIGSVFANLDQSGIQVMSVIRGLL